MFGINSEVCVPAMLCEMTLVSKKRICHSVGLIYVVGMLSHTARSKAL